MSADEKTTHARDKKTITLVLTEHETWVENDVRYTRIRGPYGNSSLPVKVRGNMAAALNARLAAMLSEGETIVGKQLAVEVTGEFNVFTNDAGQRRRWFSADKFEVVQGPALELARMRRDAASALETAEMLRKAGRIDQAYKMVTTTFAEFARVPLDLSDLDDEHLMGAISEPPLNAEKAALAQLAQEEADLRPVPLGPATPEDDIVLGDADEMEKDAEVAAPLELAVDETEGAQETADQDVGFNHDHEDEADESYQDVLLDGYAGGDDATEEAHYEADGSSEDRDEAEDDQAEQGVDDVPEVSAPAPAAAAAPVYRRRFG